MKTTRTLYLTAVSIVALFCAQASFAQVPVYRIDPAPVMTVSGNVPFGGYPQLYAVPNATIKLCSNSTCTATATAYTDATGSTACAALSPVTLPGTNICVSTTGPQGQFGFWIQPGTYYFTITVPNGTVFGPYPISSPSGVSPANTITGTFTSQQVPFANGITTLTGSPNLTWNGTTLNVFGLPVLTGTSPAITGTLTSGQVPYATGAQTVSSTANLTYNGSTVSIMGDTWPLANASGCLTNNGSGSLSWATCSGGGGGTITGSGTIGTLPVFTGATALGNSLYTQATSASVNNASIVASSTNGTSIISNNSNTSSANAFSQFAVVEGAPASAINAAFGVTSPNFVGAPLSASQGYIQVPAVGGMFAYTTNSAPWIFGIDNAEVARFTSDPTSVLTVGQASSDDYTQIPVQAIRANISGALIEARNSNTSSAMAYGGFVAKDGVYASTNDLVMGATASSFALSGGVGPGQAFIATDSVAGMVIQTRSVGSVSVQVNEVENLGVTSTGINVRQVSYAWPSTQGGGGTCLKEIDGSGALQWGSCAAGGGGVGGSGNANYIPKWTSGTNLGNSNEYDDGTTFYVGATTGGSANIPFYVQKNQNLASYFFFRNTTAGTLAQAEVIVASDQANGNLAIGVTSSTFATANNIAALTGFINSGSSNTGGLMVQANGGNITFNPSSTTVATMTSTGIGFGTVTPLGFVTVAAQQTDDGAAGKAQIIVSGAAASNDRLLVGYDTTDDNGYIQSVHNGLSDTTLLLNPNGGSVAVGTTVNSVPGTFSVSSDQSYNSGISAQIMALGLTTPNKRILLGYDTTDDLGFIQTTHINVGVTPLLINPAGGGVQIGGGNIAADDSTQIPFQVVNGSSTGTQIEVRNPTNGTGAYAQLLAVAGAAGSTNNVSIGITPAAFTPASQVQANMGYIFSGAGATSGLMVQTRANAPILFSTNAGASISAIDTSGRFISGSTASDVTGTDIIVVGTESSFVSASAATNASTISIGVDIAGTNTSINSGRTGSGTRLPFKIFTNAREGLRVDNDATNGVCVFVGAAMHRLILSGGVFIDGGVC